MGARCGSRLSLADQVRRNAVLKYLVLVLDSLVLYAMGFAVKDLEPRTEISTERELGSVWLRVTVLLSSGFEVGIIRDEEEEEEEEEEHFSILGLDEVLYPEY